MTLHENRPFRLFWAGQTASNLGDAFGFVAMPLLVFDATHSVVQMGNVTALTAGGQLLAATFSGVMVDRVHRRALMIGCDLVRLVLYGSLPLLAALGTLHLTMIFGASALGAVLVTRIGASIGVAHMMALIGLSLLLVSTAGSFSPLARAVR